MRRLPLGVSAMALAATTSMPAFAQATANATAAAGDAFGFRSGDDAVGIYDETSVRGFSLEAAGNYRVNGTYFVKNSGVSAFFLDSTTVRIGYNTLNSILPGPSGVVDYKLRDPEAGEPSQATLGLDAYSQPYAELHLKHRSAEGSTSYSVGASQVFDVRDLQGGHGGRSLLVAGTARLSPSWGVVQAFAGEYQYRRPGLFRVAAEGDALPPRIERGKFLGQRGAMEDGQRRIGGLLLNVPLSTHAGVGATAVFSQEDPTRGFVQLFRGLSPDGSAQATLVATPQQRSTAWSGELRAHAERSAGRLEQRLDLTIRLRRQQARYGGSELIDMGRAPFGKRPAERAIPTPEDAPARLRDRVDQWGAGVTYRASLGSRTRVNLGILRTDYSKTFTGSDGGPRESRSAPWLYNAGAAWRATRALELYGSYSRGLEEAGVAPATASNRNQVLDAVVVTQREAGLRYTPSASVSLVVAGFDTRKPYAGVDAASLAFRFLGQVRHRGVEASLTAKPAPGMTVLAGGVLIDPILTGEAVDAGRLGGRPVGVPKLRAITSVDYALPWAKGLSVDAGGSFVGRRPARSAPSEPTGRQLETKPLATLNVGIRYRFQAFGHDLVARAQLLNALGQFSWDVNGSETLAYSAPRRARLVLTGSF